MYHACLDPFSDFNIPFLPHTTNNLVHVMILAIDLLNLAFNLFLFKFLEKQRENNTGLSLRNNHLLSDNNTTCFTKHFLPPT